MKQRAAKLFAETQEAICTELERIDDVGKFDTDNWERTDVSGEPGGGGRNRNMAAGAVFERAGVAFSEVHGFLPKEMVEKTVGNTDDCSFYATGVSLVLHPESPMIPTTHANFRYLEVANKCWFGGGIDLSPYYLFEDDVRFFHQTIKDACDNHDPKHYPEFKDWCDRYFFLKHRDEARGVGGIFFDYVGRDDTEHMERHFAFVEELAGTFVKCYVPIVEKRRNEPYGEAERSFQLVRRGRYVEFNLLYDRGTQFGLKTGGRTESILMSLPPVVCWEYNVQPEAGTREAELVEVLKNPREWV